MNNDAVAFTECDFSVVPPTGVQSQIKNLSFILIPVNEVSYSLQGVNLLWTSSEGTPDPLYGLKIVPEWVAGDTSLLDGSRLFVTQGATTQAFGTAGCLLEPLVANVPSLITIGVMPRLAGDAATIDLTFNSDSAPVFYGSKERFACALGSKAGYFDELDERYTIRLTIVTGSTDSATTGGFRWSVVRKAI